MAVVRQPQIDMKLSTIPHINIGAPAGDAGARFEGLDLGIDLSDGVKLTFTLKEDDTLMGMLGYTPPDSPADQEAVYDLVKEALTSAAPGKDAYSLVESLAKQKGG